MDIRPIKNEVDHRAALTEIGRLWDAEDGSPEADMMEVLAILVEDYESKRWPITASSPLEILRYAVSEMGHTQSGLAALLGSRSRASELLSGKRPLTIETVRKISAAWGIPAQLLIAPYEIETAA
jgi:HTH-type transcriptional regulator / antitoxin HigA